MRVTSCLGRYVGYVAIAIIHLNTLLHKHSNH